MNWSANVFEHWQDPVLDGYHDRLFYIGAQGSQNHANLATPLSDMDTVALVYPKVEDIVTMNKDNLSICLTRQNGEHIKVYDYRFWINLLYKQNMNDVELLFTDYYIPLMNPMGPNWSDLVEIREDIARYSPARTIRTTIGIMDSRIKIAENHLTDYDIVFKQFKNCYFLDCFIGAYIHELPYKDCLNFGHFETEGYKYISVDSLIECMKSYRKYSEKRYQDYLLNHKETTNEDVRQMLTEWSSDLLTWGIKNDWYHDS